MVVLQINEQLQEHQWQLRCMYIICMYKTGLSNECINNNIEIVKWIKLNFKPILRHGQYGTHTLYNDTHFD